jgi:hypothetical protein
VGVKGELAKQVVVAALGKASSVPAHALATAIVWQIQTTVNNLSLLHIKLILVMNIRLSKHRLSCRNSRNLQILGTMQI